MKKNPRKLLNIIFRQILNKNEESWVVEYMRIEHHKEYYSLENSGIKVTSSVAKEYLKFNQFGL